MSSIISMRLFWYYAPAEVIGAHTIRRQNNIWHWWIIFCAWRTCSRTLLIQEPWASSFVTMSLFDCSKLGRRRPLSILWTTTSCLSEKKNTTYGIGGQSLQCHNFAFSGWTNNDRREPSTWSSTYSLIQCFTKPNPIDNTTQYELKIAAWFKPVCKSNDSDQVTWKTWHQKVLKIHTCTVVRSWRHF